MVSLVKRYTLFVLLSALTLSSCIEGEPGPAGPVGTTGAVGERGEKGEQGEKGETGSANVQSYTFVNKDFPNGAMTFELPALTPETFENGVVLGYIRNTGTGIWFSLPYSSFGSVMSIASIRPGKITIVSNYSGTGVDFRFVLIGGTGNTNMRTSGLPINFEDYAAVRKHYSLSD